MILAARIAGQAEVHGFCEGIDRAWLAGLIDEGLKSGEFRKNTGYPHREESWEHVTAFLRARDDEPVVMSYSVTDSFPNRRAAGWEPPPGTDLRPDWATEAPDEWAACDYKDDLAALDRFLSSWHGIVSRYVGDPEDWELMHREAEEIMAGTRPKGRPMAEVLAEQMARRGIRA